MQLSLYTDYAFRLLIHVGTRAPGELSSINEISRVYDISRSHLMKIVQDLGRAGFLETVRGRHGGIRLGRPASEIGIGALVRHTEHGCDLVDCSTCLILPACTLPRMLGEAMRAFIDVLDKYTLADLLDDRQTELRQIFAAPK